jgi:DNA (cytosine-5)-methyltransferase 1
MGTQKNQVPLVRDDYGVRKLTPRECLRFQGFSDSFGFPATVSLEQRYKQIGNSVSVPVIRSIAKQILASIRFDALVDDIL